MYLFAFPVINFQAIGSYISFQNLILYLVIFVVAIFIIFLILFFLFRYFKKKVILERSLATTLFLITLPKETLKEGGQQQIVKNLLGIADQFFSSLAAFKKASLGFFVSLFYRPYIVLEIAVCHHLKEISFYISVPSIFKNFIEKQIQSFYPKANIEIINDYNIFNFQGENAASYLMFSKSDFLPIKTYKTLEVDPLENITNAFSKLEKEGEGMAMQILIRPVSNKWVAKGREVLNLMRQGKTFHAALSAGGISEILSFETPKIQDIVKPQQKPATPIIEQETIKAIENKLSKVSFETNIRLIASAPTKEKAEILLSQLENAFSQFTDPIFNSFKIVKSKNTQDLIYSFSFRVFDKAHTIILNSEELASIYHFPTPLTGTPNIKWQKAKVAPPPLNLPEEGIILGKNIYRGEERLVRITEKDRRRHLYIIGQTGTGKSTFLHEMIRQDIEKGKGVAVLDPHGDLIEGLLTIVPKERIDDVILFDPSDLERPLGLNMLEYDRKKHPEHKTFIVNEMIDIFDKLYNLKQTGGPMFEQYMRNALQLLMGDPEITYTLMEVPKVFADSEFRSHLLSRIENIVVKDFWKKEAEKAGGEAALANLTPYITSKFNVFIANDYMRPIIGQSESSLKFREIMDQQKILFINLTKGKLGDLNSSLLGLIIVGKILMAAFSRIDISEEERKDFYLYIDEFQNFTTPSISTILSEARKYRLCLIMAHQFIAQLKEDIRNAVFGNVGSIVSFRVGVQDAEFLVKQFEPVFSISDLVNIDNFNAYIKLMINNQTTPPFNIQTIPKKMGDPSLVSKIKEISRLKYGKPRKIIEEEINERYGRKF